MCGEQRLVVVDAEWLMHAGCSNSKLKLQKEIVVYPSCNIA